MLVIELLEKSRGRYLSGELIAQYCGITRAAVWKQIKALKEQGYQIESRKGKGYCLANDCDILSQEAISSYLHDPSFQIIVKSEVTSTNDVLKELAQQGYPEKCVLIAQTQTKGKGRKGRSFYSPKDDGLYMSLLLRPKQLKPEDTLLLSALSACAVQSGIKRVTGLDTQIKWVNDIYLKGKKVCGILCEGSCSIETNEFDYIIVGIGINCHNTTFPQDIKGIAASLQSASFIRAKLAAAIIADFFKDYQTLPNRDFLSHYRKHSCVIGKMIQVYQGNQTYPAKVLDIDEHGYLIIEKDGHLETLSSGEITIRIKS